MSSTREIRERIDSIQSTLKITNAMYMISSTKLNRARQALTQTEPYFYALRSMLGRVSRHLPEEFYHPYLDFHTEIPEEERRKAIICVTADKGLAGAYNHNVLKLAEQSLAKSANNMLFVVGEVGRHYFESRHIAIDEHYTYTAQKPSMGRARKIAAQMLALYNDREVDDVYIIFTTLVNGQATAGVTQLLPLNRLHKTSDDVVAADIVQEDFNLYPSAEKLLDAIIPDFVAGYIYSALVESFAAEHSARMQAMDSANKNGQELVAELQIRYNRERQAQITQEITEVAAGAKARRQQLERRAARQRALQEAARKEAAEAAATAQ